MKRRLLSAAVFCFAVLLRCFAQTGDATPSPRPGILLLAHGGRVETWNDEVRHIADQTDERVAAWVLTSAQTASR